MGWGGDNLFLYARMRVRSNPNSPPLHISVHTYYERQSQKKQRGTLDSTSDDGVATDAGHDDDNDGSSGDDDDLIKFAEQTTRVKMILMEMV